MRVSICICTTDSLCSTPEPNSTLYINYTQIKKNFFKQRKVANTFFLNLEMKEINPKHVHKTKMKQCKAARRMKFFKCHFLTSPSPQLTFLLLPNPLTLLVCEKENLISPKKPTVPPPAVSSSPATHMSH